jgi:anti-sigma B factor antagonist
VGNFELVRGRDEEHAHAWRLTVTGDFDMSEVDTFDQAIDELVEGGGRLLILDLGDVSFLDSSGLRAVIRAKKLLAEHDGRLAITGLSGAAQRVLELSGLLDYLGASSSTPTADA